MMSITEQSFVAGFMTFLLYGLVPLALILYLMGVPERKRRRMRAENSVAQDPAAHAGNPDTSDDNNNLVKSE